MSDTTTPAARGGDGIDHTDGDSGPVTLRAHAKLTLGLRITGVRDDGYHLIDAEMVSLDLHDLVTLTPGGHGIEASGPFCDGIPLDGTNLVARAVQLAGNVDAVGVHLHKLIPHGGGLGGGSTDAATVLRWCGYGSSASALEHASRLGADIPFCLVGGRAVGREAATARRHRRWSKRRDSVRTSRSASSADEPACGASANSSSRSTTSTASSR